MIIIMNSLWDLVKYNILSGSQWLTPVIPAIYEAEIKRFMIPGQSGQDPISAEKQ
jgi:hypothetical protein